MNKWISVDFAVPPDEMKVLVSTFFGWTMSNGKNYKSVDVYIAIRKVFKNGKVKWICAQSRRYIQDSESDTKVTHWMPLPELPQKDN